jgi:hypothetical protein
MSIAEAEAPPGNVFVRHPRAVSAAYFSSAGESLADEAELESRHQSLLAFISGAEETLKKLPSDTDNDSQPSDALSSIDGTTGKTLRQLLERIQSEWRNVEAYASGLTKAGETRKRKGSRKDLAIELLNLLRGPTKLRSRMVGHIQQIFRVVRRDRDTVAFRLQRDTLSRGSIAYAIEFEDADLRSKTEKLSAAWSSNLSDAETLFELAMNCESDYDFLLGMAVSLGALGKWPLAKQYVDYALVSRPHGSRREGLFLQAVMARRMSIERQSLTEAQERMSDALQSMDEAIREHGGIDPRYFNERATLELWLIEFGRSPEGAPRCQESEMPLQPAEVAAQLQKALPFAAGKLRIQILNGLCYAYLLDEDSARMPGALEQLKDELAGSYPDRPRWPPFALDTVVYTTYRLQRGTATPRQLELWADELTAILGQDDVSSQERRLIGSHASEIAEYSTRGKSTTATPG